MRIWTEVSGIWQKPVLGRPQRPRNEANLALSLGGVVADIERPMREHPLRACAGLRPILEEALLARHVLEPVGHGLEERDFPGAARSDFLDHPPLELRPLGFPSLALDSVAAPEKAAEMDEGAAGPIQQPIDGTHQAVGLANFVAANPVRIEQLLFAKRSVIRIDDRGGLPLALAAERDLNVIGSGGTGRREHEGAGAAPFGDQEIRLLEAPPQRFNVAVILGEFGRQASSIRAMLN